MENLIASAGQYGALGLTLLASFWYINKKDEEQRIERKDVTERLEEINNRSMNAINNNTSVLSEIKGLLSK